MVQADLLHAVYQAELVIRKHLSPVPLIRSYALEKEFGFPASRRVWIKDYGWTPVGSFKLMGALNWMANNREKIGSRPTAAHSSGNFASGLAFAGKQYGVPVIIVMPDSAPQIKFQITRSYDAEIRTYEIATDHLTGVRDRLVQEIAEKEKAMLASPYDDLHVITGNGVGGLEIAQSFQSMRRDVSHFLCPVSGGGLMAGHALVIDDAFPKAKIIGIEPSGADDFRQSLAAKKRVRIAKPESICDGLLSYDVGETNWPILQQCVDMSVVSTDCEIKNAMKWLWEKHGLRTEPSGAISVAACLDRKLDLSGDADVVLVVSGRNIDHDIFDRYLNESKNPKVAS